MQRATAITNLTNEYSDLATDAKFTSDQLTTAYNFAVDMSLRQLGVTEDLLASFDVPQAQIRGYLALLNYYALKRFTRLLAVRFDVTVPQALVALRSQAYTHVMAQMEEAENECIKLGYDVGGRNTGFQMGRIELDFLEPDYPYGFIPYGSYGGGF